MCLCPRTTKYEREKVPSPKELLGNIKAIIHRRRIIRTCSPLSCRLLHFCSLLFFSFSLSLCVKLYYSIFLCTLFYYLCTITSSSPIFFTTLIHDLNL